MEPNEFQIPPNLKNLLLMAWVACLTAIVVTIIDWKIKTDILHAAQKQQERTKNEAESIRRTYSSGVYRIPDLDSDSGMEARNVVTEVQADSRDSEGARWDQFPAPRGESVTAESRNTRPVSEGTVFVPGTDNE